MKEKKVVERYNAIMNYICCEHCTIGTNYSENTEGWNLRDMVSECQYHLDCRYESGNANSDGRSVSDYMDMYGCDREDAEDAHREWLKEVGRLKRFIDKYKAEAMTMKCTSGHCSKYDNK